MFLSRVLVCLLRAVSVLCESSQVGRAAPTIRLIGAQGKQTKFHCPPPERTDWYRRDCWPCFGARDMRIQLGRSIPRGMSQMGTHDCSDPFVCSWVAVRVRGTHSSRLFPCTLSHGRWCGGMFDKTSSQRRPLCYHDSRTFGRAIQAFRNPVRGAHTHMHIYAHIEGEKKSLGRAFRPVRGLDAEPRGTRHDG